MMTFYSNAAQCADPHKTHEAINACRSLSESERETLNRYLSERVRDGYSACILRDVETCSDLKLMLSLAATDPVMTDADLSIVRMFAAIRIKAWNARRS